jgi:hypothetical protein
VDGVNAGIWSGIEINVAIFCASLPSIKPLITRVLPNLLSNAGSRGNRSNMNNLSDINYNGSHVMSNLGNTSRSKTGTRVDTGAKRNTIGGTDIKIEKTVYMQRDTRASFEGSESSLVFKADCYSEDQKKKVPRETV